MEQKKKYSEPQLTRYEEKLDEVTMGVILGSPDCNGACKKKVAG